MALPLLLLLVVLGIKTASPPMRPSPKGMRPATAASGDDTVRSILAMPVMGGDDDPLWPAASNSAR